MSLSGDSGGALPRLNSTHESVFTPSQQFGKSVYWWPWFQIRTFSAERDRAHLESDNITVVLLDIFKVVRDYWHSSVVTLRAALTEALESGRPVFENGVVVRSVTLGIPGDNLHN